MASKITVVVPPPGRLTVDLQPPDALLVIRVRILNAIEHARRHNMKPLARLVKSRRTSVEEATAAADVMLGEFVFEDRRRLKATEDAVRRKKEIVACVLDRQARGWPREAAVKDVAEQFGEVSRALVFEALAQYEKEIKQNGIMIVP
jgi:hypothetical protein